MVEFLTTMQIASTIETIIRKAKSNLVIVSPFLRVSQTFLERLVDAADKKILIRIIYGKDELKKDEREKLESIENLELHFCDNLHAKCYYNESMMVITSMNFHEFSQQNNREMGIKITKSIDSDLKVYQDAVEEVMSILNKSHKEISSLIHEKKTPSNINQKQDFHIQKKQEKAYCIRCREEIKFNPEKPFCYECYSVWNEYKRRNFRESYCHICGKYENSSMNKPVCYYCYKNISK